MAYQQNFQQGGFGQQQYGQQGGFGQQQKYGQQAPGFQQYGGSNSYIIESDGSRTYTPAAAPPFQKGASAATPLVPPGDGKWRSTLCGCTGDCSICCAVCCCHPLTSGQLYERAVQKGMLKRLPMVSCLTIALILFVLEISQEVTSAIFRQSHYTGGRHPAWPR